MRVDLLTTLLCVALASCASPDRSDATPPEGGDLARDRQVLVMLREAPQHFRPDGGYAGGYATGTGRHALRRVAERLATDYDLSVVEDWPMPSLGVECFLMRARAPEAASEAVADRLARDSRVESAQPLQFFRTLAQTDSLSSLQPAARAWRLEEMHRLATGRGVRVAAIDTGVDAAHPDLAGRVSILANFVDASAMRAEAHGTAVAGIIAARGDSHAGTVGIAPDAILLALRACWEVDEHRGARCSTFTLAKALQFAIDRNAQVINLSLTGPRDRLLGRLLDAAMAQGTTVVAAVDPQLHDGGFPASHPGVLAVDDDAPRPASPAELRAPGHDIPAPLPGGRWGFVSGPSFAAAEVSGVIAILRELAPALTSIEARNALAAPAPAGSARATIVDAYAAVERTAGACGCVVTRDATPAAIH